MKKILLFWFFLFAAIENNAQINLVKNPSFEKYLKCPTDNDEIKYANFWTPISDTTLSVIDTYGNPSCTPEYCNVCADITSGVSVPYGGGGV